MKTEIYRMFKNSFEVEEINKIVELFKEQFGAFYRPFIYYVYEELYEYLKFKENIIVADATEFIFGIMCDIMPELINICIKTLLAEFELYKEGCSSNEDSDNSLYIGYNMKIEEVDEIEKILEKYEVLSMVIWNHLCQRIHYVKECIMNFENDRVEIVQSFNMCENITINSLRITSGDTHNEGKKVAHLTVGEYSLLYKPRSLETEYIFYNLIDMLCKEKKDRFGRLIAVSRNNYSWQEFACYQEAETIEDIKKYYYRSGIALFALDLLNSHDVHRENVIACKDMPIMIDMETLVDIGPEKPKAGDYPMKYISTECVNSVIGTLLLPTNCIHMVFDFDVSGLTGTEECNTTRWYDFILVDQGKDSMRMEKTSELQFEDKGLNLLRYQGQVVNPQDYLEDFLHGYQDAYECFCVKKVSIRKLFNNSTIKIRQVLRPTAVYARFLQASVYSGYLQDKKKYEMLFEKFRGKNQDRKNEFEIASLKNRDIPYFFSEIGNKALYSYYGRIDNYFERSSLEVIFDKIEQIDDRYVEKQKYYIRLAFSTLQNKQEKIYKIHLFDASDSVNDILCKTASVIEEKMFLNEEKTDCYLLTTSITGGKRKISMLDYNLYAGGGILIFFSGMYVSTKNEHYRIIAEGLYAACNSTKAISGTQELGVFVGKMSYIYIYYFLYKYFHYENCKNSINEIKEEICKSLDLVKVENDIVSGLAGMILLSAAIVEDDVLDGFEELLYKTSSMLASRCNDILDNDKLCKTGFAHGLSGIALAMYKAGHCLKNDEYIELAMRCVRKENEFFVPDENNWADHRDGKAHLSYWCYGSAGILLARIKMQKIFFSEEIELDIERGRKTISIQAGDSQCLCHGQLGNLAIMKMLMDYYPQDKIVAENYKKAKDLIQKEIKEEGCLFGRRELFEDYSFMQGLSGIGYEFLRWKTPELPNILALEV